MKNVRVIHYSPAWKEILSSGKLLPKSALAGLASSWRNRLLFLLPRSFAQMGIFGILEPDIKKWANDPLVWKYLIRDWPLDGQPSEKVTRLTFELKHGDDVSVLEEEILFAFTRRVREASSALAKLKLILQIRRASTEYVNTITGLAEYRGNFVLPAVFILNEIPASRITCEIS